MKTIDAATLKQMRDSNENFTLINVLPEDAFRKEHIPGSVNLPVENEDFLDQVERRVSGDLNHPIVVYCANTDCTASPKAARMLEEAGYTNITDFEAGMEGWNEAGHPVETGAAPATP